MPNKNLLTVNFLNTVIKIYNNNNKNRNVTIALIAVMLKSSIATTAELVDIAIKLESLK